MLIKSNATDKPVFRIIKYISLLCNKQMYVLLIINGHIIYIKALFMIQTEIFLQLYKVASFIEATLY